MFYGLLQRGSHACGCADDIERAAQFAVAFWHQLVLDLQLADYSRTNAAGDEISAPENPGPCYSSRAMAMVHLAMYDAYVGVTGDADTYITTYSPGDFPTGASGMMRCPYPLRSPYHGSQLVTSILRERAGTLRNHLTTQACNRVLYWKT